MSNAKPTAVAIAEQHMPNNSQTLERLRVFYKGNVVAEVFQSYIEDTPMQDAQFNAGLVAEAFNTLAETGLTPRQLAEKLTEWSIVGRSQEEKIATLTKQRNDLLAKQRNDLLAALELVVSAPEAGWGLVDAINVLGQCKKAIASAKGGAS